MSGIVLAVEDARKRYGETHALAGVTVSLHAGEWLGLLGPNGAGKTTLVRSIAGRVRLDGGSMHLFGARLDGASSAEARSRLGVVPQEIALYPLLTARENLAAFAALSGLARGAADERVDWALAFTGLADRADALVQTFSGGMKRRLNIACSVLHRPAVLLLDEPTVGVDPQSRERIWEMLAELRAGGTSLLLTTHQLDEAQRVCQRIVIIDHGKIIADGTLDELIAATVGSERRVTLSLDRPLDLVGLGRGLDGAGRSVSCLMTDVAAELPSLLGRIHAQGVRVDDVAVSAPTLQAVFLHLTGRELRE